MVTGAAALLLPNLANAANVRAGDASTLADRVTIHADWRRTRTLRDCRSPPTLHLMGGVKASTRERRLWLVLTVGGATLLLVSVLAIASLGF